MIFKCWVRTALCTFKKMCQEWEVRSLGKNSSEFQTVMQGLSVGKYEWKKSWGVREMHDMTVKPNFFRAAKLQAFWYVVIKCRRSSASLRWSRQNWVSAFTEVMPAWVRKLREILVKIYIKALSQHTYRSRHTTEEHRQHLTQLGFRRSQSHSLGVSGGVLFYIT